MMRVTLRDGRTFDVERVDIVHGGALECRQQYHGPVIFMAAAGEWRTAEAV